MSQNQAELAGAVAFREARREDLASIVRLLANDSLGTWRETLGDGDLPEAYEKSVRHHRRRSAQHAHCR
jgi:hypothetical protein